MKTILQHCHIFFSFIFWNLTVDFELSSMNIYIMQCMWNTWVQASGEAYKLSGQKDYVVNYLRAKITKKKKKIHKIFTVHI